MDFHGFPLIFIAFTWPWIFMDFRPRDDESKLNKGAGSNLEKVEEEDEVVVENVQKGVRSSFYKAGRFSPTKEKGVHHFHLLLSEFLKR